MPSPQPRVRSVSDIKSKLLNPALTSHYECFFNPPDAVREWIKQRVKAGVGVNEYDYDQISISCCEASLPGSQIATYELNDDFTGVTERNAYRRQYDDRADFTFYVDHDYTIISFFENWMAYIANEQITTGVETRPEEDPTKYGYYYRMNYPKDYKADAIYIHKFERDLGKQSTLNKRYLQYRFIRPFPVSINSMPVSYESSSLLKCTVSFSYIRYIVNNLYYPNIGPDQEPKTNNTTTNNVPGNNFGVDPSIPTPTQFLPGPLSARGGRVVDM
jgi:hypothetical protein